MIGRRCLCLFALTAGLLGAQDVSLLNDREWKSEDGKGLQATLVKVGEDSITLKRKPDNREFTLPIERLSLTDRGLLLKCRADFDKLIDAADGNPTGEGNHFVGFQNPAEEVWELAYRFGYHERLWEEVTRAQWIFVGGRRVIRVTPERFERISDVEYYIHGKHVSLKVRLDQLDEKLSLSSDRLIRSTSYGKKTVAQQGVDFSPELARENLISLRLQKVGVVERLVMDVSLRR